MEELLFRHGKLKVTCDTIFSLTMLPYQLQLCKMKPCALLQLSAYFQDFASGNFDKRVVTVPVLTVLVGDHRMCKLGIQYRLKK